MKTFDIADIDRAEACGDVKLLASITRQLLEARRPVKRLKPTAEDVALLTLTERRALGLPEVKEAKRDKHGRYKWVLVEFATGFAQLVGMYPRVKSPESLVPAMATARSRYLLQLSGGRLIDPSKALDVPQIANARELTDDSEIARERYRCLRLRAAFEAFTDVGFSPAV